MEVTAEIDIEKRERLAVTLYDAQVVSQGRAAQIAGLSRAAFLDALGKYGVTPFQHNAEEILAELEMRQEQKSQRADANGHIA